MEKEIKIDSLKGDLKKTLIAVIIITAVLIVLCFLNIKTDLLTKTVNFFITQ